MTSPRLHHVRATGFALGRLAVLGLAACMASSACQAVTPTPSDVSPTPIASAISSALGSSPSGEANAAPLAGQTDTDWGRIWDDLPAGFPIYARATPAQGSQTGPASATFVVEGGDPKAIATWMQMQLKLAAYRIDALTGPFEDGSFVLGSTGSAAGCRVEIAVAPLGGLTSITVRYGAACPSP